MILTRKFYNGRFSKMIDYVSMCGIQVSNVTMNEAVEIIECFIAQRKLWFVVTPNVDHIVRLQKDIELNKIYEEASLVLPDGMPLIWASRFLKTPLKEKISGSDLFIKACELSSEKEYKLYFLGGREGAAKGTAKTLRRRYPNIKICGFYSPPFGFEKDDKENTKIVKNIQDAKPDILFVGLGSPKQEKWIYKYKNKYQVPVSIGIGVTFEFVSGMVRRAPSWMQKTGLEWFWRLIQEPKRLWKRYLINDPIFFWLVLKQKLGLFK